MVKNVFADVIDLAEKNGEIKFDSNDDPKKKSEKIHKFFISILELGFLSPNEMLKDENSKAMDEKGRESKTTDEMEIDREFIHPTFQDYFAALYVTDQLAQNNKAIEDFIHSHKNDVVYKNLFRFIVGRLSIDEKFDELNKFFDLLLAKPRELTGNYEIELFIQLLEECRANQALKCREKILESIGKRFKFFVTKENLSLYKAQLNTLIESLSSSPQVVAASSILRQCINILKDSNDQEVKSIALNVLERLPLVNTKDQREMLWKRLRVLLETCDDMKVFFRIINYALSKLNLGETQKNELMHKIQEKIRKNIDHAIMRSFRAFLSPTGNQEEIQLNSLEQFQSFYKTLNAEVLQQSFDNKTETQEQDKYVTSESLIDHIEKLEDMDESTEDENSQVIEAIFKMAVNNNAFLYIKDNQLHFDKNGELTVRPCTKKQCELFEKVGNAIFQQLGYPGPIGLKDPQVSSRSANSTGVVSSVYEEPKFSLLPILQNWIPSITLYPWLTDVFHDFFVSRDKSVHRAVPSGIRTINNITSVVPQRNLCKQDTLHRAAPHHGAFFAPRKVEDHVSVIPGALLRASMLLRRLPIK